ncbi:MAG: hypothetical protein MJ252_16945, partial [archaeon]|nr:hypothetical protein [archaeon]
MISFVNINLGKIVLEFFGDVIPIKSLFSNINHCILVSDNKEGFVNIWDVNQAMKVPSDSFSFFGVNEIISSDYNKDSSLYFALDNKGKYLIHSIKNYNEKIYEGDIKEITGNQQLNPVVIKGDLFNLNQFFICYDKGIKLFDIRKFSCINEINLDGCLNIFNN